MIAELKVILDIQDIDMELIRLALVKKEKKNELQQIEELGVNLDTQLQDKKDVLKELEHKILFHENEISILQEEMSKLEQKQSKVKKVDEFNALTQEIAVAEKKRYNHHKAANDLVEEQISHKEVVQKLEKSLEDLEESSAIVKKEIKENMDQIEKEAVELQEKRATFVDKADVKFLNLYMCLLKNKRGAVVVPITSDRVCSGCNIAVTAQHVILVRNAEQSNSNSNSNVERMLGLRCEHCSRVHFLLSDSGEGSGKFTTRKRRKRTLER